MGAATYVSAAAIGLSAFLLFLIQPMITKMILPVFGGGASVWLSGMIFFQTVLFAGYASTHMFIRAFGMRRHLYYQAALVALSLLFVPFPSRYFASDALPPPGGIFLLLLVTVGMPYFVLSTTSPVIQYWLGAGKAGGRNPYILYAVSNAGSMAGLFAFPLAMETTLPNGAQAAIWGWLFALLALLMGITVYLLQPSNGIITNGGQSDPATAPTNTMRGRWIIHAMIPSAALIVITHYLTQDVVSFPLLWVLPLGLYLLSFILCFAFPALSSKGQPRALLALLPLLCLLLMQAGILHPSLGIRVGVALTALFILCMFFHGELEREKPDKERLTSFYTWMSLGGLLGSFFAGIAAPLLFKTHFEFNLVVIAAIILIIHSDFPMRHVPRTAFNAAIICAAGIGWMRQEGSWQSGILEANRSFYAAYRVEQPSGGTLRQMVVGTHIHGVQQNGSREPLAYYHEGTGIARLLSELPSPRRVAIIGLGAGAIAGWERSGDSFDFYEIDPMVEELARRHFTFLGSGIADEKVIIGDGRLRLRTSPAGPYDIIAVDAFSSGSIPAHLITREFVAEALEKLRAGGALLFHISNRHIDLLPVLRGHAQSLNLSVARHIAPSDDDAGKFAATWVALTSGGNTIDTLLTSGAGWERMTERTPGTVLHWTDERSDLWSVITFEIE